MNAENKSPTNASKHARIARSTGKSLRALPALYAWRYVPGEHLMKKVSLIAAIMLAACASPPQFVPNAGRTYAPCKALEPCIYVVRDVISMNWINPTPRPAPQPFKVLLDIELSEDAKILNVAVARSSGNSEFDESALVAVRRAADFRELRGLDSATFQRNFRKFKLDFNPASET